MNTFTVLFFCIQACLVQNVFGQCLGRYEGLGVAEPYGYGGYADYGYPAGAYGVDAYGGIGEGNVAVAGELPVAGTTALAGQVPIMGAVRFSGDVAAGGSVSIVGKCGCGCGARRGYGYGLGAPYLY